MDFEFDPDKARNNLQKHPGVSFAHAEQSLRDDTALTIEDPDAAGEQRFLTLGMDALGRILVVCHTQRDERTRIISARKASKNEAKKNMRKDYDFSEGKRGAVITSPGKTRVTIMLDDDVIESFRARADTSGRGYQTMINEALRAAIDPEAAPVTLRTLRAVLDERFKLAA